MFLHTFSIYDSYQKTLSSFNAVRGCKADMEEGEIGINCDCNQEICAVYVGGIDGITYGSDVGRSSVAGAIAGDV